MTWKCSLCIFFLTILAILSSSSKSPARSLMKKKPKREYERLVLGKYELLTDPKKNDFHELLRAMELNDDERDAIRNNPKVVVSYEKDGHDFYVMEVNGVRTKFESGVIAETPHPYLPAIMIKVNITFSGKNRVLRHEKYLHFDCNHEGRHDNRGFSINYHCKNVTAAQRFKRVKEPEEENKQKPQKIKT